MAAVANNVSEDGWSSVSYGWTCGHCGLERLWFSSKQCRRCGAPKPTGAPSSPVAAAQVPRRNRKRGTRQTQKPSTHPEVNLAKVLDGLKDNEHFKGSEELAAMQAKVEQAWEAEKLAKRQERTPEVAVLSAFSALQTRKAAMAKSQAKISELEAVEEAKQKVEKLQGEIDKLSKEYDEERACGVPGPFWESRSPASHRSVGNRFYRPFQLVGECNAHSYGDRCARRRGLALQQDREKAFSNEAMQWPLPEPSSGRCRACPRTSERPRKRRWWSTSSKRGTFSRLKRHINTVYCACSVHAASGKGPSLESLAKILVGEGHPV